MDINQTIEYVKENILKYMPEEYQECKVKIEQVPKNNNTYLWGISIYGKQRSVPTLYVGEDLYKIHYQTNKEEIIANIAQKYLEATKHTIVFEEGMLEYKNCGKRIFPCVVNAERNEEMLKTVPHELKEDLAIVYRIAVDLDTEGMGSILISNYLFEKFNVSYEMMKEKAWNNIHEWNPPNFQSLNDLLYNIFEEGGIQDSDIELIENPLNVLSTANKMYGAVYMFDKEILKHVSDVMKGNFIILPSSVNESLIIKDDGNVNYSELKTMVMEVNRSQTEVEEQLSDNIYVYNAQEQKVSMVTDFGQEQGFTQNM